MSNNSIQENSNKIQNFILSLGIRIIGTYPTEHRAACPFCQSEPSKNPALSIYFDGHYYCHSCAKQGSVFDLGQPVEKIELEVIPKVESSEKISQAKSIYDIAAPLSKDQLSGWLSRRGFNKTQIHNCLEKIDATLGLRYREYKGEKALIVPIVSTVSGFVGIERINFERDITSPSNALWSKKALGKKDGFFFLPVKDSKSTIITESLANAFVNALMGFNSLVMFGIGNTKQLPDAVALLQKQDHAVYYFPDALGIEPETEAKEAKKFMDVLKNIPGLLGVLWPSDVKKNYDVNDLLLSIFQDADKDYSEKEKEFKDTFLAMLRNSFTHSGYMAAKNRLEAIAEIKAIAPRKIDKVSLLQAFNDQSKIKIIRASTGIGKTTAACRYAVSLMEQGEKVTLFCSTLPEAEAVTAILMGIMPKSEHNQISLVTSKTMELEESQESKKGQKELAAIAVTTYGYLGFKGESAQAYSIARALIQDRFVICDEVQEIWHKSLVMYAIANNYLKISDGETITYKEFTKCPKTSRKGSCKGCRLSFVRDAATGNPKTRHFAKSINEKGFDSMDTMPEMNGLEGCCDKTQYLHIMSNLFYKPLQEQDNMNNDLDALYSCDAQCNYRTWIATQLKWMYNPHIRIEFPTIKSGSATKPLDRQELVCLDEAGIKFPTQACAIPFLSGRNLLPFFQLLSAKGLTLMSATVPNGLVALVSDIAKQKLQEDVKEFSIDEIPFKFNLTFLKTSKRFSLDKQAQIVKGLPDEYIFCCTSRKSEAEPLYSELRRLGDVALYFRRDWESVEEIKNEGLEIEKAQNQGAVIKKIITYSRSAITRGANFPKVCIAIIDCNQFVPLAALDQINPLLSEQEIRVMMVREIRENLTQILGRFFRSEMQRESGKTLIDQRQIVVLLHGLPEAVQDFSIDERLLASCAEYKSDAFLSAIPRLEIDSVIEAIQLSRQGKQVPDRKKIDHDYIFQKALEKGLENIDSSERALLSPDDLPKLNKAREESREKAKAEGIENKLKAMKDSGLQWFKAYKKLNLDRFSKIEQSRLKALYKKI